MVNINKINDISKLERLVFTADGLVLKALANAGTGHTSTALSLGHVVGAILATIKFDKNDPLKLGSDMLILSEGHSVPVLYAFAHLLGINISGDLTNPHYITEEELLNGIRDINHPFLGGHPQPATGFKVHPLASGSLGKGLSFANGVAWGKRYLGDDKSDIYVIIGDGEFNKGQITEALRSNIKHNLFRVIPVINFNRYQQTGSVEEISGYSAEDIVEQLKALKFSVLGADGHSLTDLIEKLSIASDNNEHYAIIAYTEKGFGVSSLKKTHGTVLKPENVEDAIKELGGNANKEYSAGNHKNLSSHKPCARELKIKNLERMGEIPDPLFEKAISPREGYGRGLEELAKANPRVIVLSADVSNSDFTTFTKKSTPEQYIEIGIGEANMVGYASGLAALGLIPFANSFGAFLLDATGNINTNQLSKLKIKIGATHGDPSTGPDGPSQIGLSDISSLVSYPDMAVLSAADAYAAYRFPEIAAKYDGSVYMRFPREKVEPIYNPKSEFRVGGANKLRGGKDLTIVAHGYMVSEALKASDILQRAGISTSIVDAYSIKPLGWDIIEKAAEETNGRILTVEGNFSPGLDAQILKAANEARNLGKKFFIKSMYVKDYTISGRTADNVLSYSHLSKEHIVNKVCEMLGKEQPYKL